MGNDINDILNMQRIREMCEKGAVHITNHINRRMIDRNISIEDINNVLKFGEIIEKYPDDYPYPSCLILGASVNNKYMHVVCGVGGIEIRLITAYYPNVNEWSEDFKVRKEKNK